MAKRRNIMLAHPAEPKRVFRLGPECYVQPKLNGVRCRVMDSDNFCKIVSSSGREYKFFDHIREELSTMPPLIYDGELYIHGQNWEQINSICSRTANPHPNSLSMQFHIFDFIHPTFTQEQRANVLQTIRDNYIPKMKSVRVVRTQRIKTDDWGNYLDNFMRDGYEGIMLRGPAGFYRDHRSPNLLKFKPRRTDLYKIVRLVQGTGWCTDRLGAFEVRDKAGNVFCVGTGPCLTAGGRKELWDNRESWVDQYLLVKHEELKTINDIPKCVVAVQPLTCEELEEYKEHNDLKMEE